MGQSRTRLTACAAALSAALLAVPAALAATAETRVAAGPAALTATPAGTVTVNAACYVNTAQAAAKVVVSGADWSPGDTIQLTDLRGGISATVTVSSDGTFTATIPAPVVPTQDTETSDRIEAIDEGSDGATQPSGGPTAFSATYLTTDFAVKVSDRTSPLRKLRFNLSGFIPGRTVYGHYLTGGGRLLGTASFGKPAGACGLRTVDAYEFPGGRARRGTYAIQFDNDPHYSSRTTPQFRYRYVVSRL